MIAEAAGRVVALDRARIAQALARRERYKYVRPRVLPATAEGRGWKIVSPNCSRNIDPDGGEIDIAWLMPTDGDGWRLHARDHARGCWVLHGEGLSLRAAMSLVCADPAREFWP